MKPEQVLGYLIVFFLICLGIVLLVNHAYYEEEYYYVQPQEIEPALITPSPRRFEISTEQLMRNQKDEFEEMLNRQNIEHNRQLDSLRHDITTLQNQIDKMEKDKLWELYLVKPQPETKSNDNIWDW